MNKIASLFLILIHIIGGEGGIRTLDTGLPYTHFPGVLLQPLGHFSYSLISLNERGILTQDVIKQ